MIITIEGCQVETQDQPVYDTHIACGNLYVCRGQLFTCREVEEEFGNCEYPRKYCKHFPQNGHPKFIFSEGVPKPHDAKEAFEVVAIDGERL